MKTIFALILSSILMLCIFFEAQARIHIPYQFFYANTNDFESNYVFFGINRGLGLDEETGHEYIILENPTQVWFGNEKNPPEDLNTLPYGTPDYQYVFTTKKRDFGGRILYIEYACDKTDFHTFACDKNGWQQSIRDSVGQKIAVWISSFSTQVVDPKRSAEFPFLVYKRLTDFFFSPRHLPEEYMIGFSPSLFPERLLYQQKDVLTLYVPDSIDTIETYTCNKKGNIFPRYGGYEYLPKRLYSFVNEKFPYRISGIAKAGYHPFIKNYWESNGTYDWELDEEIFFKFFSSVLEDVNFCEEDLKKDQIVRILNIFFLKNSLIQLSK